MSRIDENELIAYHLDELSPLRKRAVRAALERDAALAAESEETAETLRAFSAGPGPIVTAAVSNRIWNSLRPSLLVLEQEKSQPRSRWMWGFASGIIACALLALLLLHRAPREPQLAHNMPAVAIAPAASHDETPMLDELHERQHGDVRTKSVHYNDRPGPLTTKPVDQEQGFAGHLDAAERLLTQVNHTEGPLPTETHGEVHRLLLQNAIYQERAQVQGDYATANVMDDLGRVLVTLDAAPPRNAEAADAFRLQMNVGNVLFDLRILHHNKAQER